jgi:WD40 repeat protein
LFSPDGRTLAASDGRRLVLWDVPGRRVRRRLSGPAGTVWAFAFAPDGRTLALVNGRDAAVVFWDVAGGRERQRFVWDAGPASAVAFAPDGLTCAAGHAAGQIVLWDVDV